MNLKRELLIAPLNWGLGHATRCIPIINALLKHKITPVIASDGAALRLLEREFQDLEFIELPSYNITYSKNAKNFKLKMIKDSPRVLKAIKKERKLIKSLVKERSFCGIISDNRLGVYSNEIPSVFITHQLNVLSGSTTWLSSKLHHNYVKKFNQCWVPDHIGTPNLSGKLGHSNTFYSKLKYIGPISRFEKNNSPNTYKLLVLLSGPEPQRTILEQKILNLLTKYKHDVLVVRGVVEQQVETEKKGRITIINYMTSKDLEAAILKSEIILSRSGYTTIMDLAKLNKKAFFIPTPGQYEQEYLAKNLDEQGLVPSCSQEEFNLDELDRVKDYSGLKSFDYVINFKKLFSLFEGK
ncbi:glycosyltransferase [Ichthyenterobacterium sp. W332]|uniref:Glycosyltransferase n=1 Tax=Microcosmobacter mediterraneus TaxID=3075607 RepID=A0ABU2YKD6_9FLAO|nr:glycosyltransferase [Ichthyenterobacterium sp. W332]MDT0558618.1 glycosyltransferase [Ichthyenterobacterium sp. W332]